MRLHFFLYSISTLIVCFLCTCCVSCINPTSRLTSENIDKKTPPVGSFVKITRLVKVKKCIPLKNSRKHCQEGEGYTSTGSGVIISSTGSGSLILSAGHMCNTDGGIGDHGMGYIEKIERYIMLQTTEGEKYSADVRYYELKNGIDLCLLYSRDMKNKEYVRFSPRKPEVGDKVYNIAAPAGIFHPPAVPILAGFYSGTMMPEETDMYTVPAVGGSSGSPVFNESYEIVGIIFAASRVFSHMSIATTYEKTLKFIKRAAKANYDNPREKEPTTFLEIIEK